MSELIETNRFSRLVCEKCGRKLQVIERQGEIFQTVEKYKCIDPKCNFEITNLEVHRHNW